MKALDSFTVERLEEIRNSFLDRIQESAPSLEEVFALIDIALAAKRAEPVGYAHKNAIKFDLHDTCRLHEQAGDENFVALYTTPQLNYPEIPDGWKLVPIELTAEMAQAAREAHEGESYLPYSIYRAMLAAAPEKENG